MKSSVIAIDIGGTKIAGGLVAFPSHSERDESTTDSLVTSDPAWTAPTPTTGGQHVADTVVTLVKRISEATGETSPIAVGIGSAGVIDSNGRTIVSATDAIPGWAGTPLADIVEQAVGLPVIIENDVHAHARGEAVFGAGAGAGSTLMVAVGTGIGGAFTFNGEIVRGARGLAGHVGHIITPQGRGHTCSCGCDGHLEAIASGPGMTRWFNTRGGSAIDARDLEQQALAGDDLAKTVLSEAATATGEIMAGFVNSLDPDIVILGGGLARAGDLYWQPLRAGFTTQLMPPLAQTPLVPATLGSSAALIGAAYLAYSHYCGAHHDASN